MDFKTLKIGNHDLSEMEYKSGEYCNCSGYCLKRDIKCWHKESKKDGAC